MKLVVALAWLAKTSPLARGRGLKPKRAAQGRDRMSPLARGRGLKPFVCAHLREWGVAPRAGAWIET